MCLRGHQQSLLLPSFILSHSNTMRRATFILLVALALATVLSEYLSPNAASAFILTAHVTSAHEYWEIFSHRHEGSF